jgi:hypothetical protein
MLPCAPHFCYVACSVTCLPDLKPDRVLIMYGAMRQCADTVCGDAAFMSSPCHIELVLAEKEVPIKAEQVHTLNLTLKDLLGLPNCVTYGMWPPRLQTVLAMKSVRFVCSPT